MPSFPASVETKRLNEKHPDYSANAQAWTEIDLLYRDGAALKAEAERFLRRKPRESAEVYRHRLARFTSRPVLGTALGWYQSAMFSRDPEIVISRGGNPAGGFYDKFLSDCDRSGTSFIDFGRSIFESLLLFGSAYVLTDRSPVNDNYASRLDQERAGALDAYLVLYPPGQVIDWESDEYGALAWVLIAVTDWSREFPGIATATDLWYYFDREMCAVYEAPRKDGRPADRAVLRAGYPRPHALSGSGRVPVRRICVPEGLWLGNRAYLSACTHLDLVNALDWGIFNACLPTLYIKGDYRDDVNRSEVTYLALPEGGEAGYIEPAGTSFEIAMRQIDRWREELYRQVYLQAQGRSTEATPAAQSGYSKEMDMAPSRDVLNGLGDVLRSGMTGLLGDVAAARGDDLDVGVRGFEFPADDSAEIDRDEKFISLSLGITVEKEVKKRLASRALKDADPALIRRAHEEINAMKTNDELAREEIARRVAGSFGAIG